MKRYHPDLGIPAHVRTPRAAALLTYTHHARSEAAKDRVTPPTALDTTAPTTRLFEVVTDDLGNVVKLGYRVRHHDGRDCCLVVDPRRSTWTVVTCWANAADDDHKTLRPELYDRP